MDAANKTRPGGDFLARLIVTLIVLVCLPDCLLTISWLAVQVAIRFPNPPLTGVHVSSYVAVFGPLSWIVAFGLWIFLLVAKSWATKLLTLGWVVLAGFSILVLRS